MAFTFTRTQTLVDGSDKVVGNTSTASAAARYGFDDTIANTVEEEIDIAFLMADVQGVAVLASVAMTLSVNDLHSGSPAQTIALAANRELVWMAGDNAVMPFTANVTKLYGYNNSGGSGTLKIRILADPN